MKQGTVSVLFGCHSIIHSVMVILAWKHLYGSMPQPWESICILLHDIGHWGKQYLDNVEEKWHHGDLGAKIAGRLFGSRGYDLVMGHNAVLPSERSRLFKPDKYSWVMAPVSWMIISNFIEPKLVRPGCTRRESAIMFKNAMKESCDNGFTLMGHDIYLEQWGIPKRIDNE